ncbi:MAG TPA: PKD domain-containing protein, partial [Bacteroidales bacterium]|nr:PKD domain-containing protein [Bacteroidales bacterium]
YAYSQYPTGYYPLWGQIIPDTTVVLKWNDVSGATSYNIQVATDVNFNVLVLNQSNITVDTLLITGLDKNTIYYWRVSVHTGPNSGVWSPLKMFRCFIPSGLPNLTLWLRADKGIVLSGSNVVIWQDQSGNAYNFSQSTSSNQPLLVANAINYLPAIKFDGTNDYLATSTPITGIDASSITLFCLAKGNSQSGGSSNAKSMFSIGTTATGFWLARNVSNQKLMLYNKGSSIITTATLPNTGFGYRIFGAVKTYASDTKVYQNDTLVGYSTNANIIGSFTNNNANIGGNSVTSGALYNGEIAEMVLYTSALNDNDRQIVERYLAAKYNKSYVNLGKDKIQNNKSLCSINLDAGFGFKSYLWSTGDTISNINVYSSGTYWVSVIDAFGYSSVDTINVNVFDIKLNCNDTTICYGTSLNISPVGITSQSGLSYLWSTGDTTSSIHVSSQGQYWVKVIDSIGCFKYSDTITVSVDMFPSTMTLGPDTSFCSGNYIKLLSPSSNFSNLVFNWSDGSNDSILVINYSGTYWVSVTNTNGCIAIDTINVIITGIAPQVNFLADTVCLGEYTHFTDLSVAAPLDNINQWLWSFGDGNNSNLQNPIYKYSNYGIYNVSLTATTIGGCYKTIVKQVLVNDSVGVYFTASPMNCINNYTFFFSQTLPGQNDSIMSYLWDFDDPSSGINNNSTLPEPQHMYMTPGTYNVSLTVYTYKGCTKTIILPVSVISSALLPGGFMLLNPVDSLIIDDTTITFSWSNSLNAYYYKLEIASDQSFNSIIASFTGIQNLYKTVNLSFNSGMYFWRIKAYNICGDSTISNVFCFQIFNSTTIPGMTLWYKVNSGVNVINNNEVLKWLDCSGNNKHAFQNTSSLRPTYIPNALNGWPVLHFGKTGQNGERTYLNFDTVKFTNGNFSIFTVYKAIDINKSFHYFLSGGTGTSFKGGCHAGGTYTGINGYGIYGVGGINGRNAAEEPINWGIVTYFNNKLYRNSKEANYSLQGTVNDIYINTIGTRLDYANFFFYGDIAEIIVYDNKLNTQQQAFIERYLHDKYAGP